VEDVETPSETFCILMWWKVNSAKFSVLSEIARDVLAIPITTVVSESTKYSTSSKSMSAKSIHLVVKMIKKFGKPIKVESDGAT
jgi:hypothetical protein